MDEKDQHGRGSSLVSTFPRPVSDARMMFSSHSSGMLHTRIRARVARFFLAWMCSFFFSFLALWSMEPIASRLLTLRVLPIVDVRDRDDEFDGEAWHTRGEPILRPTREPYDAQRARTEADRCKIGSLHGGSGPFNDRESPEMYWQGSICLVARAKREEPSSFVK